jgi:hypothetical protein
MGALKFLRCMQVKDSRPTHRDFSAREGLQILSRAMSFCQLISRVWLPFVLLLETSSDRQHIRHLFGRSLLVL